MSKGPITARINQVVKSNDYFTLCVSSVTTERESRIKLPKEANVSAFKPDKIITFYLKEPVSSNESFVLHKRQDEQPVLIFLSNSLGVPLKGGLLWLESGKETLNLEKLPRIAELLLEASPYYGQRRDLAEKALHVLWLTQDEETLDALFSMRAKNLFMLLGGCLALTKHVPKTPIHRDFDFGDAEGLFIPVQIADCLLTMALSGVDLENPRQSDLWRILYLAQQHGESKEKINKFIADYKQQ